MLLKVVGKAIGRECRDLALRLGVGPRMVARDRIVLEQQLLPELLASTKPQEVLFIGCHWYTWHYEKALFAGHRLSTIDMDARRRRYGATRHVVDSAERLRTHYDAGQFDLIVFNGVIGWGLNDPQAADVVVDQCWQCLESAGRLLVGIDHAPEHHPFELDDLPSLRRFKAVPFTSLAAHRHRCPGEHQHEFSLWQKIEAEPLS